MEFINRGRIMMNRIYCENCQEEVDPVKEIDGDGNEMYKRTFYLLVCPECDEILNSKTKISIDI